MGILGSGIVDDMSDKDGAGDGATGWVIVLTCATVMDVSS